MNRARALTPTGVRSYTDCCAPFFSKTYIFFYRSIHHVIPRFVTTPHQEPSGYYLYEVRNAHYRFVGRDYRLLFSSLGYMASFNFEKRKRNYLFFFLKKFSSLKEGMESSWFFFDEDQKISNLLRSASSLMF